MFGQQILHKLRRTRCCAALVDDYFSGSLRRTASQRHLKLVNNTPYLMLTFLVCCVTRFSELATQNNVLIEEHCEQNFCLASNLANFLRPLGRRRFPSLWFCLCFWIVATDSCLSPVMFHKKPASDSSHCVCEQAILHLFSCQHSWVELRHRSCHAQILGSQLHGTNPLLRTFLWSLVFYNLSTKHHFINQIILTARSTVVRDVCRFPQIFALL